MSGEGRVLSPVEWPRHDSGHIMWREVEEWERPVECPLCGAAVTDTDAHVRWHEANQ